jgi:hypothetical protein
MVLCPLSSVLFVNEGTAYGIFLLGRVIIYRQAWVSMQPA